MQHRQFARAAFITIAVALALTACARIEIRPEKTADETGLRFHRPKPYLWLGLTEKGTCEAKLLWLPDTSETWVIRPHAGVGTVTFKPTLTDGWNLTAFDATVDSKVAENLGAVGDLVTAAAAAGPPPRSGPGLYAIQFDQKTGLVTGLQSIFTLYDKDGKPISCGVPGAGGGKPPEK